MSGECDECFEHTLQCVCIKSIPQENFPLQIIIPGEPKAQVRPRVFRKVAFDPQKPLKTSTKFQILDVIQRLKKLKNYFPFSKKTAVEVEIDFYMTPLKQNGFLHEWGICDNVDKKDVDNMGKFYTDCMTGIIYEDDRQINTLVLKKYYDDNARTEIRIMPKKSCISDKTKELLSEIPMKFFVKFSEDIHAIADGWSEVGISELDYLDVAILLCDFAEKYTNSLKKINKKFPKFANVLIEEKNKRGVK